jgi:titin
MKIGSTTVASFRLGSNTPSKVYVGAAEAWTAVVATVPAAVTGIDATTSTTQQAAADVDWDAPNNGGSPITGYNIYYSRDGGTTWVAAGSAASSPGVLAALYLGGESVKVDVRAVNSVGVGPSADPIGQPMVTLSNSVPSAPTAFTATPVAGYNIYAAWNQPTYDGGPSVTDYEVSYFVNGMETTLSVNTNNYTVDLSSMNGGQEVQVRVRASNNGGIEGGPWSDTLTATVADVPSETSASANSSYLSQGAVILSIDVPSSNYSPITSYDVEYGNDGTNFPVSFNFTDQNTGSFNFSKEITGLTGGVSYYFRVRFRNAIGNAPWTSTNISASASNTPPSQITDFSVTPNYQSYPYQWNMAWTYPANGGSSITWYEIQEDSSATFSNPTTMQQSQSPISRNVETQDSTRYFRIRASNSLGNGEWSSPITAYYDTPTVPGAPTITNAYYDSFNDRTYIEYNFPADNGNSTITAYTFYFDGSALSPAENNPGAGNGVAWFYQDYQGAMATMSATNSVGQGPASAGFTVT